MICKLKALGLSLFAILALGALSAQGVQAHEFHGDGEKGVGTGIDTTDHEFTIGTAGVVKCTTMEAEGTQAGTFVSAGTYTSDTGTVTPRYSGCSFGGQPATVNFEHCAYLFDSDTTAGNTTGGEHANVELKCAEGNSVKVKTSICTLTIGQQLIKHAVRYEDDPGNKNAGIVIATAHGVVISHSGVGGCALVPKGAVGKYVGTSTGTCYREDGNELTGTDKTTPQGLTTEGPETECKLGPDA